MAEKKPTRASPAHPTFRKIVGTLEATPTHRRGLRELEMSKKEAEAEFAKQGERWRADVFAAGERAETSDRLAKKAAADERKRKAAERKAEREEAARQKRIKLHADALRADGVDVEITDSGARAEMEASDG